MKKNRTLGFIWQIIIALFLLLPLTVSFIYSFAGRWTSILPQNLTFQFYIDKFTDSAFSLEFYAVFSSPHSLLSLLTSSFC